MYKLLLSLLLVLAPVSLKATDNEFNCLVRNIYHEARAEPLKGQIAVGLVTLNRTETKGYPSTICGVVYQKSQFSWTKGYKKVKVNEVQWKKAEEAALSALMERDFSFKATHFHNKTVNPRWKLRKVATIANHTFYR